MKSLIENQKKIEEIQKKINDLNFEIKKLEEINNENDGNHENQLIIEEVLQTSIIELQYENKSKFFDTSLIDYSDIDEIYKSTLESSYATNNRPMSINDLRDILNKIEEQGANFLSIEYHCDHNGYYFSGFNVFTK